MSETGQEAGIRAEELVKFYGKREVVKGVNLLVRPGEIVGLLGPNGAGKTTTFYMIAGLIKPTGGKVYLDGEEVTGLPMYKRARKGIGYLPQEPSVFRRLTVRENIEAIVEVMGKKGEEVDREVERHLKELDLEGVKDQMAYTLSGGERRRLEITRALVVEPRFFLLDEPFSGVDPISVHEVQEIVVSLKKKGMGILITDHNVAEMLKIVDRAYLIHDGKLLAEGSAEELLADSRSRKLYFGESFNI